MRVFPGITVLLALTVYMLIVAEELPPTPEVIPLIGQTHQSNFTKVTKEYALETRVFFLTLLALDTVIRFVDVC